MPAPLRGTGQGWGSGGVEAGIDGRMPAWLPFSRSGYEARGRAPIPLAVDMVQLNLAMLGDTARTSGYLTAIRDLVRPNDVVVDIGTGTGVLAVAAAQAGAGRVYAIEGRGIGRCAHRLFADNGFADRILLVPGWSTSLVLPERADVLISELIGDEPISEGVVEITRDAVRRLLKPGARLIPGTVELYGLPLTIPDDELAKLAFTTNTLERWGATYGIDFSSLATVREIEAFRHFVNPYRMRDWSFLTAPIKLATVDLTERWRPWIRARRTASVARQGRLDGVAVYFELTAASQRFLSTHPQQVRDSNHWLSPVQLFSEPLALREGDRIDLNYWYSARRQRSGCDVSLRQ